VGLWNINGMSIGDRRDAVSRRRRVIQGTRNRRPR